MSLPNVPNPAPGISGVLRSYYTMDERLTHVQSDMGGMKTEMSGIRTEHIGMSARLATVEEALRGIAADVVELKALRADAAILRNENAELKTRLAVLEEARKTTEAQTRAVVAETVAELKTRFAEVEADLRVRAAESELARRQAPSLPPQQNT